MKKIICTLTTLALCAAMPITAFASTPITSVNGTDSADVKGTYKAGTAAETIYSVDVSWGSMAFTYNAGAAGTWNPDEHAYTGSAEGAWSCETDANKILVTNHSNVAVDAALNYTQETGYTGITGTFTEISGTMNDKKLELASADGTTVTNAPKDAAHLNLEGTLKENVENIKIGTVTITISDHEPGIEQDED